MTKIAYLFGAGASANALPVVNQMPQRILEMAEKLPEWDASKNLNNGFQKVCTEEQLTQISNELRWLYDIIGDHETVDTLAKKLHIKDDNKSYTRLNYALAAYLVLEQYYTKPDKRYDNFWVKLINDQTRRLPSNISILSWNYDSQFEISFLPYSRCAGDPEDISLELDLDYGDKPRPKDSIGFSITRLNGTALPKLNNPLLSEIGSLSNTTSRYVYEKYFSTNKLCDGSFGPLQFAWSLSKKQMWTDKISETYQARIQSKASDAEVLVVIGYSFPRFNKEIDKMIIENMPKLRKVYIQDPNSEEIAHTFRSICDKNLEIEKIDSTGQFFLPPELD